MENLENTDASPDNWCVVVYKMKGFIPEISVKHDGVVGVAKFLLEKSEVKFDSWQFEHNYVENPAVPVAGEFSLVVWVNVHGLTPFLQENEISPLILEAFLNNNAVMAEAVEMRPGEYNLFEFQVKNVVYPKID